MTSTEIKKLLKMEPAAKGIGKSVSWLQKKVFEGKAPFIRIGGRKIETIAGGRKQIVYKGGRILFDEDQLIKWFNAEMVQTNVYTG